MSEILKIIISAAGFSGLFTLVLFFALKNWFLERLRNSIKHEYDVKLETLKADLKKSTDMELAKLESSLKQSSADNESKLNHDKKLFEKLNAIVDEREFYHVCESIGQRFFHTGEQFAKLEELMRFGEEINNQFLSDTLKNKHSVFNNRLNDFLTEAAMNSFSMGNNTFAVHPERKNSSDPEQREIYSKAAEELRNLSNEVFDLYREFRQEVKSVLHI